ncbi:uncharacterized protein LOC111305523 isoform X2 [Durio zibethinus]|uniref:Uncharacterized protein LOC111305523 isoform X2 n=1 Tax=Durio zibethinus TaxID=66656 RepID=A0A6P6A2B7_DURZI|nr:uncharacterized protein LOC111305523 isoform X2 [Durio zibethinus]
MASEVPDEPPCNTQETDEETIALRKKRSRRVSFADREITSVHIFNRDDDYETPPDSTPKPATEREKELLGLFSDLVDSDDSNSGDGNEDEDDDVLSVRKSFLRPMESPSPGGSSTVGSATSNDEDNFFGPVSANFIRPGRLSDCAASDDNHDITMDSTAFSMHFRSIVRSESGDLNTSTGVPLASEEKTPFQATMPSDPESFMVLTNVKKLKSPSPAPINKFSGGRDSNDMSLVGESMHRYDYGRLSPTLEALLAEGSKEFNAIPASDSTSPKLTMSAIFHDNENDCMEPSNSGNPELCNSNNHDMSGEGISIAHNKLVEATGDSTTTLIDQIMRDCLSNTNDGPIVEDFVDHQIQTPNRLNRGNKEISEVVSGTSLLNSEFLVVATGTPLNQNSEAFQLNLLKQFEYGNQPPTRDGLKENSPQDQRHTSNVGHASSQPHGSPLAGSIHSISATRQQILLGTPSSPRRALFVTPSTKQSGSVLSKGSIKQGESVPSILKSNSELKFLEPSPCASAFNNGAVKSKCRLSESPSSRACSFNTIMEEMNEGLQCQQATAPTNNLEEQLSGVGLKQGEVDCNGLGTPKNISRLSQDGGTTGHAKDKEHNDNSTEILAKFTSPSNFSHSGKKVMHHSLISVDSVDGTLVASTFNSSPTEITLDISQDKGDTDMLYKLVSPLVNRLNGKLSSPTEHKGSLLGNLKLHDQNNNAIIVSRRECNSVETVLSSSNLTATCENRTQSSSPLIKVNRLTDSLQNTSETSKNFPDGVALKLQSGSPEKNIQTAVEINRPSKYFIGEQMKVSSAFVSPDAHGSKNELLPEKSPSKKKQIQSPTSKQPNLSSCVKEMHSALHGDNMQLSVAKDVVSINCSSTVQRIDDCHQRYTQNPSPVQDIQNSSKRKRTSEEVAIVDVHCADKNNCIQQSPKFHKVEENNREHMSEYLNGSNVENERTEGGKTLMNWTDIYLKLSAATNQLLSPCFDKLNVKMINMLEDKLLHQQKVNKLEMLCSEIQSQLRSAYHESSNILLKRVAETRPLLNRIVYEKAKLQLMHVKRERLLKEVQLLRTGVWESQMLKLNWVKHPSVSAEKDTQLGDNSSSVTFRNNLEGVSDKVTTMKHEDEALEKKIKNLTKSFHVYCKIKGELSCSDTIELVNDHLKKRTCCRFIRQDIQLWEVDNLQNRNDHHNVILNYHGFICQSLTLNAGPNSSIFVANKLNDINISKNFPNMDSCSAFAFVFNHESTKKYVGPKTLAQETQRTSSLLRNLLDVVEEVQIAQLEIRNLTLTSFHSPSAKQLDLQLAFIDFDSGIKVMMTLDVTCLNCGVYPSEIVPYHLQTPTVGAENLQHRPLSAEIKVAVGNLRAGYSRVIRLCRCVSQVVQSSGRG